MTGPGPEPWSVREELDNRFARQNRRWGRLRPRRTAVRTAVRILGAALALGAVIAFVASRPTIRLRPDAQFAVPRSMAGCTGVRTLRDGARVLPITVRHAEGQAVMFTEICLEGEGPFPFIIDTGAATTAIAAPVVARFDLRKLGSPQRFLGIGCSISSQEERIDNWSVAGLPLKSQVVAVQAIAGLGRRGEADGLLGASTLSSFGAVRFDFAAQTMTFPGPEAVPPLTRTETRGPGTTPIPAALLTGPAPATAGLTVLEGPTYAEAAATVHFKGSKGGVLVGVDTGSSQSVVDSSLARVARLAGTNLVEGQNTVCSSITVPLVRSGPWSVGALPLVALPLGSTDLGQLTDSGILGLLGLDELSHYRYVIIDFQNATIAFGPLAH